MIVVEFAMETVRHALLLQWPSQKTGKRGVNKLLNFNGFNLESKKGPFPILMWIRLVTANKVLFLFYFPPKDEKVASIFTRSALPEGSCNDAWGNSPKHDGTGCSTYSSDLQTKSTQESVRRKIQPLLFDFVVVVLIVLEVFGYQMKQLSELFYMLSTDFLVKEF